MLIAVHGVLQVIYTTLLKVYVKGGLFEKSKELLKELEALGYAEDEVHFFFLGYHFFKIFPKILFCILINSIFCEVYWRRAINLYRKRISFEALYYIDSWLFLSVIGVNTKRVWYSFVSLNSIMAYLIHGAHLQNILHMELQFGNISTVYWISFKRKYG